MNHADLQFDAIADWMVSIPAGSISLRDDRKKTRWEAKVSEFLLSKFLVTQEIYSLITTEQPSVFPGEDRPVESVSWFDAVQFCNALSENSGIERYYTIDVDSESVGIVDGATGYRLPTDAEWEYSCRAGTGKVQYAPLEQIAWFNENSQQRTNGVGLKDPNEFGLFDMLGNVWEWCWDLYDPEVYGSYRIFRGGGWSDAPRGCLASNRRRSHPTFTVDDLGFRVARSISVGGQ